MNIKGIILACLFSSLIYGLGLASGAYGLARGWSNLAAAKAYEKGYHEGARAMLDTIRRIKRSNTPQA